MTTVLAGLLMLAAGFIWALWSGTHPAKKPDGFKGQDGSSPNAQHSLLSGTDGFSGDGRTNAPAAERRIDLSRAMGDGTKPSDASTLPDDPDSSPSL